MLLARSCESDRPHIFVPSCNRGSTIERRAKRLAKHVGYNELSLHYSRFFSIYFTVLLQGRRISFVVARTSLYRGPLHRGSTFISVQLNIDF